VKKGTSVGKFLAMVKGQIGTDFSDIRAVSPDDLMYIKEDLIIPHVSDLRPRWWVWVS
jgi:protein FAM50